MNPNDPDVIALSKAIIQHESGGDFNAVGDAGTSHGAAQWQPETWKAQAKEVLGDENAQMTPQNQKAVIQVEIAKDKAAGLNPAQIAAKWNSGSPTGWENKIGTTSINGQQIKYNVPAYVKSVTDLYQQYKGQTAPTSGSFNPTPFSKPTGSNPGALDLSGVQTTTPSPTPDTSTFLGQAGHQISNRAQEGGAAASQALTGGSEILQGNIGQGAQDVFNGTLQTVGAGAGLIGDLTNTALEHTPIVGAALKGIEGLIGQGVGALASTSTGQAVVNAVKSFSDSHPQIAKDIGAGFNIITAIPILKGLGAVKNIAGDAIASALKGVAEKGATKDLTAAVMRTKPGASYLTKNPDAIQTLIDQRALPDIENGKYVVTDAQHTLGNRISAIEEGELQPLLAQGNGPAVSQKLPLEVVRQEALTNAKQSLIAPESVNKMFDLIKEKYGDFVTLSQMNEAKRLVSKRISEAAFDAPEASANKLVRSSLQQGVENGAKSLGLDDVAAINQKMGNLIKAQDLLGYIDRKPVTTGRMGSILRDAATAGGEMAGNATGIPLAGAYVGRETGGMVAKKIAGLKNGVLKRTGKDAIRIPLKSAGKSVAKGTMSALIQKASGQ